MLYLSEFRFVSEEREYKIISNNWKMHNRNVYPFKIASRNLLESISFEPITILYGDNGSGKSTLLNIIAERIGATRETEFNKTQFYEEYVDHCDDYFENRDYEEARIITSDDVFNFLIDIRKINEGVDTIRENLLEEYFEYRNSSEVLSSLDDYERFKKRNKYNRISEFTFEKENMNENIRTHSNGESAFRYFSERIRDNGLYLLDEPENSLSPKLQLELSKLLKDSARYLGCQFIISTHSPFLLSMENVLIYDLDSSPVDIKSWTELENVRMYFDFFLSHKDKYIE